MTVIAWDGKVLASDTRSFEEVNLDFVENYNEEECKCLLKALLPPSKDDMAKFYRLQDGERKIYVPKKLYYREFLVQAIGISGDTETIKMVKRIPEDGNLLSEDSPLFLRDCSAIIVTEVGIFVTNNYLDNISIMRYPRDTFYSIGVGKSEPLNGARAVSMKSIALVNIASVRNGTNGGECDFWPDKGKIISRIPINDKPIEDMKLYYDEVLKVTSNRKTSLDA